MKKIEDSSAPLYFDIIKIIFEDYNGHKALIRYLDEYNYQRYSLDKVLKIAKQNGYIDGIITVLAENPTNGKVFTYGNYLDGKWWETGVLDGYA